jgi:hypothetical protein
VKQIPTQGFFLPALLFFSMALVDSGHVYSTFLRTHFNQEERKSTLKYWTYPGAVFLSLFAWYVLRLPYFWSFVVYFNVYHQIRQFYGITRWYEKLYGRTSFWNHFFVYVLSAGPFVIYHFRPDARGGYYTDTELFLLTPFTTLYPWLTFIYILSVLAWVGYESALLMRYDRREPGRILSILTGGFIYAFAFFLGNDQAEVLVPLQVSHGIAYFRLLALSLKRVQPAVYKTFPRALTIVIATAVFFGGIEGGIVERFIDFDTNYTLSPANPFLAFIYALILTPQLCHFIFDARIWRIQHREAKLVFA